MSNDAHSCAAEAALGELSWGLGVASALRNKHHLHHPSSRVGAGLLRTGRTHKLTQYGNLFEENKCAVGARKWEGCCEVAQTWTSLQIETVCVWQNSSSTSGRLWIWLLCPIILLVKILQVSDLSRPRVVKSGPSLSKGVVYPLKRCPSLLTSAFEMMYNEMMFLKILI